MCSSIQVRAFATASSQLLAWPIKCPFQYTHLSDLSHLTCAPVPDLDFKYPHSISKLLSGLVVVEYQRPIDLMPPLFPSYKEPAMHLYTFMPRSTGQDTWNSTATTTSTALSFSTAEQNHSHYSANIFFHPYYLSLDSRDRFSRVQDPALDPFRNLAWTFSSRFTLLND